MSTPEQRLRDQHELFDAQLDKLLRKLRGKWVVFSKGTVQSSHGHETDAIRAALSLYRSEDEFIIVQVTPAAY